MKFKLVNSKNNIRHGEIKTLHGIIKTPVFMPCATSGAVKGISQQELEDIGFQIILGNTYHLYLRPGQDNIKKMGGIQKWMNWNKPILTDSGGYQAFSLGESNWTNKTDRIDKTDKSDAERSLVEITPRGIYFRSHMDGSKHLFTPEKVIDIQLALGSDIVMPLDFCPSADASFEEIEKAVDMTNAWFKRGFNHFQKETSKNKNKPSIFAIIQGGAEKKLREKSFSYLSQFPVDGFAIGGVANGGESKIKQKKALKYTIKLLPQNKPRYLMGVGEPEDIIYAINCGVDMFDCVLPTRLGRHGTVWVTSDWIKFSKIDLRKTKFTLDKNTIMEDCKCPTCKAKYSRGYISHLLRIKEMLGLRLTSIHNLWILYELAQRNREK